MRARGHLVWAQLVWALPAAVTLAFALPGLGHPVLWQDELATLSATQRSMADLVRLSAHRDGVLAAYYTIVHVWTALTGASAAMLRLPSAVAMAGAAAVTALLGRRLFGSWAGLTAGLVLAVLPSATRYGQEARAEALTVLAAAVCSWVLVRILVEGGGRRWWALYAITVVGLGLSQLTALVLLGAHAIAVLGQRRDDAPVRPVARSWAVSVAAALVVLAPVAVVGSRQSGQVSWIPRTSLITLRTLPDQVFLSSLVGWPVILLALGALICGLRRGDEADQLSARWSTVVAASLALVPIGGLLLVSLATPIFRGRYVQFALVGFALLIGQLIGALAGMPAARPVVRRVPLLMPVLLPVLVVAGIVLLGIPAQREARADTRYGQPDYRAVAAVVAAREQPGDAFVVPVLHGVRYRIGLDAYLSAAGRPRDVLAVRTAAQAASLDSAQCAAASCLGTPARLWIGCLAACRDPLHDLEPAVAKAVTTAGYRVREVWRVSGAGIALFTR